jgi:DNA-binding transcriptional ArsR family regulator
MMSMVVEAATLTALASPRRREILRLVWNDEREAGEIHRAMPDVTFGAVSQHLKALRDARLIEQRADGRHRLYRARREALGPIGRSLEAMWSDALWRLKLQAELLETRRGPEPVAHRDRRARRSSRKHTRAARSRRTH